MKLKELKRTAMLSWSPAQHHPIHLASGTSAQQLDASFSSSSSLELFELNLSDPSLEMKSCGSISTSHRFHKLVWSPSNREGGDVLVAGGENGNVVLYDPVKIISADSDVVIAESHRHMGPVRALDINPFQMNLIASGGNESEIYIWDLNNFASPMTPGPKTQPLEDICCVAWNRQVQHIVASSGSSGRTSVWDLRKNQLIITVSDHSSRVHCSGLAWSPEVATQLVMASEDDRTPVIQMWDLRFASSPLRVFENHTRGVLAIAWSCADPELLLSCGKDSRIMCLNPNTAEVQYELHTGNQWCYDLQWSPRNPALFSAAAFNGFINVYSIMGGSSRAQSQIHVDQITSPFSSVDPFGMPPLELLQSMTLPTTVQPLQKAPRWTRKPAGASFAFGGKLVLLQNENLTHPEQRAVLVSQVVTEADLLKSSDKLEATLSSGRFVEFCQEKIQSTRNVFEKTVWSFLKATLDSDSRCRILELLGFNKQDLALKISAVLTENHPQVNFPPLLDTQSALDQLSAADPVSEEELNLNSSVDLQPAATEDLWFPSDSDTGHTEMEENMSSVAPLAVDPAPSVQSEGAPEVSAEEMIYQEPEETVGQETVDKESEEMEEQELDETGDQEVEEMVEPEVKVDQKCEENLENEEKVDHEPDKEQLDEEEIILQEELTEPAGSDAPVEHVLQALSEATLQDPCVEVCEDVDLMLNNEDVLRIAAGINCDVDGLITEALLTGNLEAAVELCLHYNRLADGLILAVAGGADLLEKTQKKYFQKSQSKLNKLLSAVVMRDLSNVLATCELHNWKEALAVVMTYAQPEEFISLCDLLGDRLESVPDTQLQAQACLCYICAGNVDKLVCCWTKAQSSSSPQLLQDLMEKVVVMQQAAEHTRSSAPVAIGVLLAKYMCEYVNLLASQGCLSTAMTYLPQETNQLCLQQLHERLIHALGHQDPPSQSTSSKDPPAPANHNNPYSALQATTTSSLHQCYQPVRAASTVTSWSNQTPTVFSQMPGPLPDHSKVGRPNPVFVAPTAAVPIESNQFHRSQNGWNDPPILSRVPKKKMVPENYTPPPPIIAPITAPVGVFLDVVPSGPLQTVAPYLCVHPLQPQAVNPTPTISAEGGPGASETLTADVIQLKPTAPEKVLKKPIPNEHLVLKTTFEGLVQKCLAAAQEPQTKRKLDDVNKRLESLYDKLREQTLSPAIVAGLHHVARSVASRSYTEGIRLHTNIISNSNFSEISAFMPVLKVLLTQADKLNV